MKKIVLISVAIHVALAIILAPWLKTRMEFDKTEEANRTEEVRKRELARQEHDRLKREKQKIDQETAQKLRKEAERQKKKEIADEVKRLRKLRDEIMEHQQRELAEIRHRKLEDILAAEQIELAKQARKIAAHAEKFTGNAMRRSLCIGAYDNGHERGSNSWIDRVRIHRQLLAPPFEATPVHAFDFDGNLNDSVTGKGGELQQYAKLEESPDTGGQALRGNGKNAHAKLWPIEFGEQFTIVAKVKLLAEKEKQDRQQLLFANCHSDEYNRGFRILAEPTTADASATQIALITSGSKQKGLKTRSHDGAFTFGEWHELAIAIDKPGGTARIYIDGQDVTAPDSEVAVDTATDGSTIDGSAEAMAKDFAKNIEEKTPTPADVAELNKQLDTMTEKFDQRMTETPDAHDVRNEIKLATDAAKEMKQTLAGLEPKTDLGEMNDTSASVADKMDPGGEGDAQTASAGELYNEARELEKQIAEAAADINAAEEAGKANTSFSEAREGNSAATPPRPDLAGALASNSGSPSTVGDLNQFRQNLDRARHEVSDMAARAQNILGSAENRSSTSGQMPGSRFAAQRSRYIAASARQGYGAVVDMTGFGSGDTEGSSEGMRSDLTGEGADMAFGKKIASLRLNEHAIMPKALPGRRFTEQSSRKGWLYLDTWYVIGPWENESKVDFELVHPPEYGVDFDAEYQDGKFADKLGHPDQTLTWQFYQSDSVRCQPPRVYGAATYYAHTEVWFEQARDMLIAVASDDAASLWLNDRIIWQDSGQSVWQLGEGYRKVHFRQGYNTLLVRIENGPTHCVWSVLLCPPEAMEKK